MIDEFETAKVAHIHEPVVTQLGMFAVLAPLHRHTPYETLFKSAATDDGPMNASPWDMDC